MALRQAQAWAVLPEREPAQAQVVLPGREQAQAWAVLPEREPAQAQVVLPGREQAQVVLRERGQALVVLRGRARLEAVPQVWREQQVSEPLQPGPGLAERESRRLQAPRGDK